jgi:DNA-binding transcriptional LysR family regulator
MELRHVRVFIALAEELHFGRTARRLHVAQSAVSHTLAALEEELGTQLRIPPPTHISRSLTTSSASAHTIP